MDSDADNSGPFAKLPSEALGWLALGTLPFLLRLLALIVDTHWWGLNALAFTSEGYSLTITGLAVITPALALYSYKHRHDTGDTTQGTLQASFLQRRGTALTLALVFGAVSFFLSADSHLFGDGYALLGSLAQHDVLFAHPLSFLADKTIALFYQPLAGVTDRALNDAGLALQTLTALSCSVSVWTWLRISARLGRNNTETLFLSVMTVFAGATLLFFGNGEFYTPAVVIISLIVLSFIAVIQAVDATKRYRAAGALALLTILAPFYLAQLIFILPGAVFMLGLGLAPGPKRERMWGILSLVTLVAIVAVIYWQARDNLWIQARIVGLSGKPPEFDYSLFSLRRLFDILNTSFILWPLFPLTLWLCVRYVWRERCDHIVGGLAILSLSSAVWVFIADFPGGSAREITTVAMFALPTSALAAYLWIKRFRNKRWFGRTTVTLSLIVALTFAALAPVYIDGEAGVQYLDHDYQNRKDRYLNGLVDFRDHYFFRKEFSKADTWEWSFRRKSPAFLDHQSLGILYNRGEYGKALDRLTLLMSTNPYWATLYSTKAAALQALGRNKQALATIDRGLELSPADVSMMTVRGNILRALKKPDSARAMYRRALKYDSHNTATRKDLGLFEIENGRPLEAERQAYLIFEDDPQSPYPFLLVGLAAYDMQKYERARRYLNVAVGRGQNMPETNLARMVLNHIADIKTQ